MSHTCQPWYSLLRVVSLRLLALLSLGWQFAIGTGIGGIFPQQSVSCCCCCCCLGSGLFAYLYKHIALPLLDTPKESLFRTAMCFLMPTRWRPLLAVSQSDLWHATGDATRLTHTSTSTHTHTCWKAMAAGHWAKMKTLLTGSQRKRTEKVIHPAKSHFEIFQYLHSVFFKICTYYTLDLWRKV